MKMKRVLPLVVIMSLTPAVLVGGNARAEGDRRGGDHGYTGLVNVTEKERKNNPELGRRSSMVPKEQLIHGGPDIVTDGDDSPVLDD